MRAEVPLLAVQALLLGWVLLTGPLAGAYQAPSAAQALRSDAQRHVVRDPSGHLPLRGMAGFSGDQADACLRLEGFLITVITTLQQGGVPTSLQPHQVPARVAGSSCAVDDPQLTPLLGELSAGWRALGRPPVGPIGAR